MAVLVFFHAHPDDESIFTGGTMALLARNGHRVVLVVATSGELGSAGTHDDLAHVRRRETECSAAILGIDRVEFLGYRDSGMAGDPGNDHVDSFVRSDRDQASWRLASLLIDEHADALITYDSQGVYGHPDHLVTHRVGLAAAELAGTPTVYECTVDGEYLHFVESHLLDGARHPDQPVAMLGSPTVVISNFVDVSEQLDRKREAIAAHASQIAETSAVLTMDARSFAAVYGYEWFIRSGPEGAIDALGRSLTAL
jgi:LmbE family N-acetylglucosaminyl deacetylase